MSSFVEQIMELEARKQELLGKAKAEALKIAEKAVADLNSLGFNYRLVESVPSSMSSYVGTGTRTRRSGIADDVLAVVKASDGMSRGDIIEKMDAGDNKSAQQSISNALSNLKKKGLVTAVDGLYRAA